MTRTRPQSARQGARPGGDHRRFDAAPRAHDGKWVVWKKRTPPQTVSMEWVAVYVADSRKAALKAICDFIDIQHDDGPPRAGAEKAPPGRGGQQTTQPPGSVRESLHT
jgi:hypothetical protein